MGYNGTILLYGQTGSGKTYTISNDLNNPNLKGIIPRTFEYLFEKIQTINTEEQNLKININIAFIQIYLETIQDLLCPQNSVKIREHSEKGIFLENCQWINVANEKECKEAFQRGEKNRVIEFNNKNESITKSHTILLISIEKYYSNEEIEQKVVTKGVLYLVDLAGSERIGQSYLKGKQLEQAKKINNSLGVLGNCINNIIKGNSYVPYRESNLTRILQDSLGGNSNTSLIVTLSPSNMNSEETYSSLNFASNAMQVLVNPKINIETNTNNALNQLNQKYIELFEKYNELELKYKNKENENNFINDEKLEKEIEENKLKEKIIADNQEKLKEININLKQKEDIINNLNSELNKMKQINKVSSLQNNELNKKIELLLSLNKNNKIIFEPETKELLEQQEIEIKEIDNKYINSIIKQLINIINKKNSENNDLKNQKNILNTSLEQIKKNYEDKFNIIEIEKKTILNKYPIYLEKIDNLEKENDKLRNINNINLEQMNIIEEEKNQLGNQFKKLKKIELEKNILKNKINSLNEKNKKLSEINSQLKIQNKEMESKFQTEVKKYQDYKFPRFTNYSNKNENNRLISENNYNEKLFNNSLNLILNNLEAFNKLRKEIKGIESIIENDIPSLTENNYDIIIKKARYYNNKLDQLIYNVDDININDNILLKNFDIKENIRKLDEINQSYKENLINIYLVLSKTFNKVIELCQMNNKFKEEKLQHLKVRKKDQLKEQILENNIKNKIFEISLNSIDEFKPLCYFTNNEDLKEEIYNLKKESELLNSFEIMEKITNVLKKLIERSAEFRIHKEREIKNLNDKITYFLSEIENYKKYYNNNKTSDIDEEKRLLNNQLFLQDGEIIRLNKENDKLLKTIENLINKNDEININKQ